ncbi:cation:proton antiporter [Nocardia zapadnayensis]|uniref:cation:proton antiporter n=1 Tax=Nocardia rhamnosiphila TaxID=426716 RepID=UPI002247DA38|nr:cation:proton antiporter [Nocardia zapadnayensis]MCX0272672.1 cation:proton antiporter [Nocardia zapadnayensis]
MDQLVLTFAILFAAVLAEAIGRRIGVASAVLMTLFGVALSLLLPFAAYGLAESWGGSGVLAVLVCALYLTDAVTEFADADYRVVGNSFRGRPAGSAGRPP